MNSTPTSGSKIRFAAIDFETAYWGRGNACALGIVVSDEEKVLDEWYTLIRPYSLTFDEGCSEVNGIYPEDVLDKEELPYFFEEIKKRIQGALVFAHNANFDMGVLGDGLDLYDLPLIPFKYGDTVPLSRVLWKDLDNHKLNTVAEHLGFDFHHHQALDDARACAFIVREALKKTGAHSIYNLMEQAGLKLSPFKKKARKEHKHKKEEPKFVQQILF